MALLDLFVAAFMPVLKVLLVSALGSFLATDKIDILGPEARTHLNRMLFYVFNPSLVASNLAKSITHKTVTMLWFMPINILIMYTVGSAFGWIVLKITRAPENLRGLVLGCCAAGNLAIPLIIIPAICKEKHSPFGAVDACRTHGLAYASLSMAIGAIFLWSYVYNLIRVCSMRSSSKAEPEDSKLTLSVEEQKNHLQGRNVELLPVQEISRNDQHVDQAHPDVAAMKETTERQILYKIKQYLQMAMKSLNLRAVLAPATVGATVGFIIGTVPEFQKVMIGDTAPLRVVEDSASILGDAAIPTVTIILGANLLRGLKGGSDIHLPVIAWIVAVKYIAMPTIGTLFVKGAIHLGLVPPDPLYQFLLLLQFAVPPAMNIGTITQLFGVGEKECSVIMLWAYAVASISLTFWSGFFIWLVS